VAAGSKPKAAKTVKSAVKSKPAAKKAKAKAGPGKTVKGKTAAGKTAAGKTVTTKVTKAARAAAKPKAAAAKAAAKKPGIPAEVQKLHKLILKSLDDDKAEDIVSIDLSGKSSMADYLVIASGRSSRQVGAIAEHLIERISATVGRKLKAEGKAVGDWVLIDTGDIVVHIFRPEVRGFYNLEKMWGAMIPEPAAA